MSAMRSPVRPSHIGGMVRFLTVPARILDNSEVSLFLSYPTITFIPKVTVIGRSVFFRKVKQGTPR